MLRFVTAFRLLMIAGLSLLVIACGQTGPLYHPGENTPYGPPEYSIFHPHGPQAKNSSAQQTSPPATNSIAKSSNSTAN